MYFNKNQLTIINTVMETKIDNLLKLLENKYERPKVLIVDNQFKNTTALKLAFKGSDVQFIKTSSVDEALKASISNKFILAIFNLPIPGMDDYDLTALLREQENDSVLPIIFISDDKINPLFNRCDNGSFVFFIRPFYFQQLVNKIKYFLSKHQQEISNLELIENLQKRNKELETMNEELEAFSYSISHDLKTPLRIIYSYSKILEEHFTENLHEEGKKVTELILKTSQKMETMVVDFLSFAKLGNTTIDEREIYMNPIINTVLEEITPLVTQKKNFILHNLAASIGDKKMIKQVWANLISNAIKYSEKKIAPIIEIGYYPNGDKNVYYIKDNGAGFDMKYYDKLFGAFQRLHSDREFDGTGLGLAIIKRIIQKHQGKIWAESKINEGATFYFSLPALNVNTV